MTPLFDLLSITRIIQTILALIDLGLNASVVDWFNTHEAIGRPPGYLVFLVFTSVWTLLISIPYNTFTSTYFPAYTNRYTSVAVELVTTIFWFSGFIAGAVWLAKADTCTGLICNNARAGVAFAAIIFLCYCMTIYFPIKYCFFAGEDRGFGDQSHAMGMSGAERITRARMRRDAANNARIKAENEGLPTGYVGRLKLGAKSGWDVIKVRSGNVMQEWKAKAGGDRDSRIGRREMSERDHMGSMV